jgi:hypothetical protein
MASVHRPPAECAAASIASDKAAYAGILRKTTAL